VLEYCGGGSLQRFLTKSGACDRPYSLGIGEARSVDIAYQIASALDHMHSLGICHRDIKPDNVLFTDLELNNVKLCDFGFAVACGNRRVRTICGTPQYMAPEIEALGRKQPYHGWAADMWAFGSVVFELLEGKPAFRGSSQQQLNTRIMRASHEAYTAATPALARGLIKRILVVDANARLTAKDALAHPWFAACRQREAELRPMAPAESAAVDVDVLQHADTTWPASVTEDRRQMEPMMDAFDGTVSDEFEQPRDEKATIELE